MRFNYLIGLETNPYRNLAREEVLLKSLSDGEAILYLWQNENTIVVGRNQDVCSECRADEFIRNGGKVVRRKSGGGAVYHDLGNLNFSILSKAVDYEKTVYHNIIISALERIGIKAEFNGKNDILVKNRKCSGNAIYRCNDSVCQHGTLLIDTDVNAMNYYLTPERLKLDRNHVSSISSRVINLREIDPIISVNTMIQAFIDSVKAEELKSAIDEKEIDEMAFVYKSDYWIYGGLR